MGRPRVHRQIVRLLRTSAVVVLALGALGIGLAVAAAAPAAALSCAPHPDGSPAAIASGSERLASGDAFFDTYDAAVLGTVAAIATDEGDTGTYGATTVTVEVAAVLGDASLPASAEISSPDPGWMSGYPFEVGRTYLIPVQLVGPAGQRNASFVCDPISEILPSAIDDLVTLAADSGIDAMPAAEPDAADAWPPAADPDGPDAGPTAAERPSDGSRLFGVAVAVAATVAIVAVVVVAAVRRLTQSHVRVVVS